MADWRKGVTFNDHGQESLLALELAAREQQPAWLLCGIEYEAEFYRHYDPMKDVYTGDVWYEQYLDQLPLEWQTKAHGVRYQLHRVTDEKACLAIWRMAGSDKGINHAVISGVSDPQGIRDVVHEHYYADAQFTLSGVSQWSYWLNYGGGSDEYYACFETYRKMSFKVFEQLMNEHGIEHIGLKVRRGG
jgi:hypothetical protein